jgi:hypothetical protein
MSKPVLSDAAFLERLSEHKCLAPEIRARLKQMASIAHRSEALRKDPLRTDYTAARRYNELRPRYDSYGQFEGYYG